MNASINSKSTGACRLTASTFRKTCPIPQHVTLTWAIFDPVRRG